MVFRWPTFSGILILSPYHQVKKKQQKNLVSVGPPLTKFSGSAHDVFCLPGLNQYKAVDKVSCSRTQLSDSDESVSRTSKSSIPSLIATMLLCKNDKSSYKFS